MRTKYIAIGTAALVLLLAAGLGRMVWRAHRDLVTLKVRNAPLQEVLRKIERQTGEKIHVDSSLETRVKLNVTNKPLAEVLELLGRQIGARPVTLYAVYDSKPALHRLKSALKTGDSLNAIGWTNLALGQPWITWAGSNMPVFAGGSFTSVAPGSARMLIGGETGKAAEIEKRVREMRLGGPGGKGAVTFFGPGTHSLFSQSKDGRTEVQYGFTPERLVTETRLSSRLDGSSTPTATPEGAAQAARKARGRWTTLYALEKAPPGMALLTRPHAKTSVFFQPGAHGTTPLGTNAGEIFRQSTSATNSQLANLEQSARLRRLEEFNNFTPEQRVQRARERRALHRTNP